MNRIFKTKWSDSHKQYVVTDENHSNKGKTAKSAVTILKVVQNRHDTQVKMTF